MATKKESEEKVLTKDDERVSIFIPYIEGEDPEVTVGINGVYTKIQKGKMVKVTRPVASALANSNAQLMAALETQKKFQNQRTDI